MHTYLRKTARDRDASGEEKVHRMAQAVHDTEIVAKKRKRNMQKLTKNERSGTTASQTNITEVEDWEDELEDNEGMVEMNG
ncbi:hypothetical protein H0H93_005186 [Arthromyces matolae]|nr:hypothetical protein H0H93_005186 [Arthromyces matolae]